MRAVDRAALAVSYEQGDSLRTCGKRFGISPPAAARLLREDGVTIRPPRPYKARADAAALAAAYAAGHTLVECGQQYGISAPTVARILREHGVILRRACRRPARDQAARPAALAPRRRPPGWWRGPGPRTAPGVRPAPARPAPRRVPVADGQPGAPGRELGAALRHAWLAAGWSQAQLARKAGYARSTISTAESRGTGTTREFWERCDHALDTGLALTAGYDRLAPPPGPPAAAALPCEPATRALAALTALGWPVTSHDGRPMLECGSHADALQVPRAAGILAAAWWRGTGGAADPVTLLALLGPAAAMARHAARCLILPGGIRVTPPA